MSVRRGRLSVAITALALMIAAPSALFASMIQGPIEDLTSGGSVTLDRLLPGGDLAAVQVGDKVFDDFFYSQIGDVPSPDFVNVFGFTDDDGNFGIQFNGAFFDLPGNPNASDATIAFTVQVSEEGLRDGFLISGAHLTIAGVGLDDNSFITVDEELFAGGALSGSLEATATTFNTDDPIENLVDWTELDEPAESLRVVKDILLFAGPDANLPARLSVIQQSFSQVQDLIPEPASASMILMACAGGLYRRRR